MEIISYSAETTGQVARRLRDGATAAQRKAAAMGNADPDIVEEHAAGFEAEVRVTFTASADDTARMEAEGAIESYAPGVDSSGASCMVCEAVGNGVGETREASLLDAIELLRSLGHRDAADTIQVQERLVPRAVEGW